MLKHFVPVSLARLSFHSAVLAGTNDPYASIEQYAKWADYWGSKLINVGDKGHINTQSDLGACKEGLLLLKSFTNMSK